MALADVTGHGIGPALLAAVCRAYARSNFSADHYLLTAMQRLNGALARDVGAGRFVTFVAAACTPGNARVELLSAGHGPCLSTGSGKTASTPCRLKDCRWASCPISPPKSLLF